MSISSLSSPSMRCTSLSPLRYSIRWCNFSQFSMAGDLILVVKNAVARLISCLALLVMYRTFATMVWKAAAASLDSFLQSSLTTKRLSGAALVLERHFPMIWYPCWVLDGWVVHLQYSNYIVMHGNLALPLVGEIQWHTPILVGFAPMDFHLPQTILKYTLILDSKPSNSIVNKCRGFIRDLAIINVETDYYLLLLTTLLATHPLYGLILYPCFVGLFTHFL